MLHKLSLLMTGLVMMMGAAWFGLHTYGAPEPDAPTPRDTDAADANSTPAPEREETRDASEEDKKAALLIARAKLNAQLIADAAPIAAVVVETVASAAKPATEPKPVALKPVAAKPEPVKIEPKKASPVAAKKEAAPSAAPKPAAAKPTPPKADATKPKSIDDILDSLD